MTKMDLQIRPTGFLVILLVHNVASYPLKSVEQISIVKQCLNKIGCSGKDFNHLKERDARDFEVEINSRFQALNKEIETHKLRNESWTAKMMYQMDLLNNTLCKEIQTLTETHKLRNESWTAKMMDQMDLLNNTLCKEIQTLTNTTKLERGLRLYFQSLFDMGEFMEELFIKYWPKWTKEHRPNKQYDERFWKILLMNIEEELILKLRIIILNSGIPQKNFIHLLGGIIKARSKEAHYKLSDDEKLEAFARIKQKHHLTDQNVVNIILFALTNGNLSFIMDKKEIDSLENTVHQKTSDERKAFKLIMMEKFITPQDLESELESVLGNFERKFSWEAKTKGVNIKAIAYAVTDKAAFVLFSSFDGAYFFWSKREDIGLGEYAQQSMVIVQSNKLYFDKDNSYVKIVANRDKILSQVHDIIKQDSNVDFKPMTALMVPNSDKRIDDSCITVIYKFTSMESLLTIYQQLKTIIPIFNPLVELAANKKIEEEMTIPSTLDIKNFKLFHTF